MEYSAGQRVHDIGILIVEDDYLSVQQIRDVVAQTREQLQAALEEKQFLIREAYHRTKNNMGAIINLLKLQTTRVLDEQVTKLYQAIEQRIRAMLLVQQRLYQTDDVRIIELKSYYEELAHTITRNTCADPSLVNLQLDFEDVCVSADTAVACGLVLNELITNALKYAFPHDCVGTIAIRLRTLSDASIELRFSDDGVGLPADFDLSSTKTLGLRLIRMFVTQQLRGKLDILQDSRTEFVIVLPPRLNTANYSEAPSQ